MLFQEHCRIWTAGLTTTMTITTNTTAEHGIMSFCPLTSRMIRVVVLALTTAKTINLRIALAPVVAPVTTVLKTKTTSGLHIGITDGMITSKAGANRLLQIVTVIAAVEWGVLGHSKDILQPRLRAAPSLMKNALVSTVSVLKTSVILIPGTRH